MATTSAPTVTVTTPTARELLLRAVSLLDQVHGLLRDAAAISQPHRVANLAEAAADLRDDCSTDAAELGEQHDSHVTLRAEHLKQHDAHVLAFRSQPAPVVTPKPSPYRELQAQCKAAGLSSKGKAVELQSRLAKHAVATRKAEPAAAAPTLAMAATVSKTVSVDVPVDRADVIRKLLSCSDADFASFAGLLATPTAKAA
jgi:hypothetical protein